MGSRDHVGGDDMLCDHAQHEDDVGGLEFENMSDPIQLSHPNLTTFDDFVQIHEQIRR